MPAGWLLRTRSWRSLQEAASAALDAGDAADAARLYGRAIARAGTRVDPVTLGLLHHNHGLALDFAGEGLAAVEALRRSRDVLLAQPEGAEHLVTVLSRLGAVQIEVGELDDGVHALERALALAQGGAQVAEARMNLGIGLKDASRLTEALGHLGQALSVARAEGLTDVAAHCLTGLGLTEEKLQRLGPAQGHYEQALVLYRQLTDRRNEATVLHNLATLHAAQQEFDQAVDRFSEALRLDESLQNERGVADFAAAQASLAQSRGELSRAKTLHEQALQVYLTHGFRRRAVDPLVGLAVLARDGGDHEEAGRHLGQAHELATELGDPHVIHEVALHRGDLATLDGDRDAARGHYLEAAGAMAGMRRMLLREDDALAYFGADHLASVDRLVFLAAERGDLRECVEWIERAKGQELLRQLRDVELPHPRGAPQVAIDQERDAVRRLRALTLTLRESDVTDAQQLQDYQDARDALDTATAQLAPYDPELVALRTGETSTWREVTALLGRLDPAGDGVFVHFYVRGDATAVIGLRPGHEPELVIVPVTREHLSGLTTGTGGGRWADPALTALVAPVARWTRPGDPVQLSPHSVLHRLPLHAVPVDGVPLGERNCVAYAPSVTVLRHCLAKDTTGHDNDGLLVLADASTARPLAFGRDQARALLDLFDAAGRPAVAHERGAATRAALAAGLQAGYLHLAVHGYADPDTGLASGVRLADGDLTARDVMRLRLGCHLVALAACDSALGEQRPGDELLGLTRSLIYAGAPSVLATLWRVDQLSTSMLVVAFYRLLLDGERRAQALRKAQLHLRAVTVTDALAYLDDARRRADGDLRALVAIGFATTQLRLKARDCAQARLDVAAVLDQDLTAVERRSAEQLSQRAEVMALAHREPDYSGRPFDDPRHWAAFVLIGAP